MITPIDIVRYWRASLADGQLSSLPDKVPMREVEWDTVRAGRIGAEVAKALVGDWLVSGNGKASKGNRAGGKDEPTPVPVLIAPLVFIARHHHGNSGRNSDKPYAPLIVPAQMAPDGKLSFDPAKHQPWMWRGALEPSAASEPPLGSLDDFDAFRSSTPRPEDSDWGKLIEYTEGLCKALTGAALADVAIDGYDRGPAMVLAAFPPFSPSKHLIALADALTAEEASLPATLISACRSGPLRPQMGISDRWDASARHYGQMGADYPLADRQRDAVHHLGACVEGDVLPVNGPPGTGKTTLLQSIVATMVVEAALAGGEPPVIAVTSTNNQAVTNVIDSFAKVEPPAHRRDDPLEARWLQSARALVDDADDPVKAISRKSRQRTEERWRLLACLTPCFVSTLFMLPKHLQFYAPDGDNKNPPLTGFVDLLIVDEAGQVPAEIGGVGLSLGRKALVVGDIHQIEPVWSVGQHIDEGNINRYGLRDQADQLDEAGCRASSGSLMRVARHASAFVGETKKDPGIFLAEHRRCQTPIVAVCNDLVYANQLVPCTPTLSDPILPPLGWANVRSPSGRRGGSRFNAGEAEAIAEWLERRRGEIEQRYGKPIHELVGIVTPFSAQKGEIRSALGRHGIDGDLTVGTVHALQGAEREIVLFSPVHTAEDGGRPFFDRGPNMVNVAVSRARHTFLVFGDMRVFDPERAVGKVPSGALAKHLFGRPEYEILDALTRPDFVAEGTAAHTIRLDSLEAHQETLREAFGRATRRVLVVSPYLSSDAVSRDGVDALVAAARGRGVAVTIAFDPQLNQKSGRLKAASAEAAGALAKVGAEIVERTRIHNKTLAVDDSWIVEGSFNWLSAVRDPSLPYARMERSLRYQGPDAEEFVKNAWREVMG